MLPGSDVDVVTMEHRSVPCAVPAAAVVAIDSRGEHLDDSGLWPGETVAGELGESRVIVLRTAGGERAILCADVSMEHLAAEPMPLPPLLREVLDLPHVEGLVNIDGRLVWLVDPDAIVDP